MDTIYYPENEAKELLNITINGIYNLVQNKVALTNCNQMLPLESIDLIIAVWMKVM